MRTLQERECSKCKKTKRITEFYYHRVRKHYISACKECNSKVCAQYQRGKIKEHDSNFILSARAANIKRFAKFKKVPVMEDLSSHLKELWGSQDGKCFYTGMDMKLTGYHDGDTCAATVDRVVPGTGYVKGNVVLCISIVNRAKQNMSCNEFFDLCELMIKNKSRIQLLLKDLPGV